jgi:hypothetical protein
MGLSERQMAMVAKYRAEHPDSERASEQREARAKEREARAKLREAQNALKEAVGRRPGWTFDPHTKDAHLILTPLHGRGSWLGGIAYVRADPIAGGYESIFRGRSPMVPRYPFTDNMSDPTDALKAVEKWLQDGLEGISASRAESEAYDSFLKFLIAEFGQKKGAELLVKFQNSQL